MDTSFRDCDRLLFHDLVDCHSVNIGHLVKFIYANDTAIRKNHCSGLEPSLASIAISGNGSCQTDTRTSASGSGNCEWGSAQYEAK